MLNIQNLKRKFFSIIVMAFWIASAYAGQKLGELHLESKHIDRLVLQRKDGHTKQFTRSVKTIQLPVAVYRLKQVRLDESIYHGRTFLK